MRPSGGMMNFRSLRLAPASAWMCKGAPKHTTESLGPVFVAIITKCCHMQRRRRLYFRALWNVTEEQDLTKGDAMRALCLGVLADSLHSSAWLPYTCTLDAKVARN